MLSLKAVVGESLFRTKYFICFCPAYYNRGVKNMFTGYQREQYINIYGCRPSSLFKNMLP